MPFDQNSNIKCCKLEKIWSAQAFQQQEFGFGSGDMPEVDKLALAKDFIIGLNEEVTELASASTNYKEHILGDLRISESAILEEAVDVIKYLISLMHLYGITHEEFYNRFIRKTEVIRHRVKVAQAKLTSDSRLIGLDLDGCVVDLGPLDDELAEIANSCESPSQILAKQEALKFEWREKGKFLDLSPIDNSIECIKLFKEIGYKVAIITARPYKKHKRLYSDTIRWLDRYGVPYDLLLFGRDKAEIICDHLKPAFPQWFVEDREKHALEVSALGITVFLLDLKGEKEVDAPLVKTVNSWQEIVHNIHKEKIDA